MFDLPRITKSGLVRHVDYHETSGSTNDRALELATRGELPLPLLVLTERQTGGRGRGTNRWWSADGALTFSLVLDAADLLPAVRPQVALATGLAICESLAEVCPRAEWQVKWPNDVIGDGRKACGILCESVPGWPERIVVGIGINVNNAVGIPGSGFLEEGRMEATALVDLDGLQRDLTEVLLAVLDRLDWRWRGLVERGFCEISRDYHQRCFLTGKTVYITSGDHSFVGLCHGINVHGLLVVATGSDQRTFVAGSVTPVA